MDVENLGNETGVAKGLDVIFCPACGENETITVEDTDDNGNAYTWERGPVGFSSLDLAQSNWHEVAGSLYCSVYCAAIGGGASEDEAQAARVGHTEEYAGVLKEERIAEAKAVLEAEGFSVPDLRKE